MASTSDYMLTTVDNPFDPFTHFEEWYKYDMLSGHNTCGYLSNMSHTSQKLSDERNEQEIYRAMREIVDQEPLIYRLVSKAS